MTLSEKLDEFSDNELALLLELLEDNHSVEAGSRGLSAGSAPSGRSVLIAYYLQQSTTEPTEPTDSAIEQIDGLEELELRNYCQEHLPRHMCPVRFVALNQFPSLPNGKLDYKQLPTPARLAPIDNSSVQESDSETLNTLIGLLKNLLGMDEVRASDNFFEIGGDSITAIQFISQARTAGLTVSIADVTQSSSIAEIASLSTHEQLAESQGDSSSNDSTGNFAASGLSENEIDDFLKGLE